MIKINLKLHSLCELLLNYFPYGKCLGIKTLLATEICKIMPLTFKIFIVIQVLHEVYANLIGKFKLDSLFFIDQVQSKSWFARCAEAKFQAQFISTQN